MKDVNVDALANIGELHTKVAQAEERQPETIDPPYYSDLKIEPIDVIEAWGLNFTEGCIVKYLARAGRKGGSAEAKADQLKCANYAFRVATGRWLPRWAVREGADD